MSSISLCSQESSTLESEPPQRMAAIEPQSLQQIPIRLPNHLASGECTTDGSMVAVKPLCSSDSGIDNAVIDTQTQCAAPGPSRFLALPIELRRLNLSSVLPYSWSDDKFGTVWQSGDTSVLRTCHQLHEEGTSVLYTSNAFQLRLTTKWGEHSTELPHTVDKAPTLDASMYFCCVSQNGRAHIFRQFLEPFPMRPEGVSLIRRWEIYIYGMYHYMRINGCQDPFTLASMLRDRMQYLVSSRLQGGQDLKMVRVIWECQRWDIQRSEAYNDEHRETILKPLCDKGMAVEEVIDLW